MRSLFAVSLALLLAAPASAEDGQVLFRTTGASAAFAVSPDGKWVAVAVDQTVRLIEVASGKEQRTITGPASALAFRPDGKALAIGGTGVKLWDLESGRETATLAPKVERIRSLSFRADGKVLATGAPKAGARLWDAATGEELAAFDLEFYGVTSVALSADGKLLAAGGHEMVRPPPPGFPPPLKFQVWDVATKKPVFDGPWPAVGGPLAFSPDGKTLAVAAAGGPELWDVAGRKVRATLNGHQNFPQGVAVSPDGNRVATGCDQGVIKLWDSAGAAREFTRKAGGAVRGLAFSGDGKTLVSVEATDDGTAVRTWDATDERRAYLHMPLPDECFALAVGGSVVFAATNAGVSRWDLKTGRELPLLKDHAFGLDGAAFGTDGKAIATLDRGGTLRLWDTETTKVRLNLPDAGKYIAAFSPDGSALAVGDGVAVRVLAAADGKERFSLRGHRKSVVGVAFTPDGKAILTASQDHALKWWDAATGKELGSAKHGAIIASVAVSGDGKRVATGGEDGVVKLWDAVTRDELAALEGHERTVRSLAFSPDGGTLASGSSDDSCRLWDVAAKKVRTVIPRAGGPWSMAFSPDGKTLLTAGASRTVMFWDTERGKEKSRP